MQKLYTLARTQHTVWILLLVKKKKMVLSKCSRNARTIVPNDRKEGSKAERSGQPRVDLLCNARNLLMTMCCMDLKK